jgi:hypothetical protein
MSENQETTTMELDEFLEMLGDTAEYEQPQQESDPLAFERYVNYYLMEEVLFNTEVYDNTKQTPIIKWAEEIGLAYHTLLAMGMSRTEAYEMVFNKATFDHNIKMQEIGKETAIAQSEAVIGNQISNAL